MTGAEAHGLHVSVLWGSHPLCHRVGGHGTQTPSWISPVRRGHLSPDKVKPRGTLVSSPLGGGLRTGRGGFGPGGCP